MKVYPNLNKRYIYQTIWVKTWWVEKTHKLCLQFPSGSFLLARQRIISLRLNQTCLLRYVVIILKMWLWITELLSRNTKYDTSSQDRLWDDHLRSIIARQLLFRGFLSIDERMVVWTCWPVPSTVLFVNKPDGICLLNILTSTVLSGTTLVCLQLNFFAIYLSM